MKGYRLILFPSMVLALFGCESFEVQKRIPYRVTPPPVQNYEEEAFKQLFERGDWKSVEQMKEEVAKAHAKLVEETKDLPYVFPKDCYECLLLPPSKEGYLLYRRFYLGDTSYGLPLYLELRVGGSLEDYFGKLDGGREAFEKGVWKGGEYYLGRGGRINKGLSHGFKEEERGLFIAETARNGKLYVLHLEGPWSSVERYRQEFERRLPGSRLEIQER